MFSSKERHKRELKKKPSIVLPCIAGLGIKRNILGRNLCTNARFKKKKKN